MFSQKKVGSVQKELKTHLDTDGEGDKTISSIHQDVVLTVTKDGKNVILNRKIQIDDSSGKIGACCYSI